jgi:tetratricopeptide (TPR) repeat protein
MLKRVLDGLLKGKGARVEQGIAAATEHLKAGRFAPALDMAETVLAERPSHPEALYIRGTARLETGAATSALADLQRATELRPDEARYRYNLAVAHWHLGDATGTERLCREIVAREDFAPARRFLSGMDLHGEGYFDVLYRLHRHFRPAAYLEIGVATGQSLRRALDETVAIGVDPDPHIEGPIGPNQRVFRETSDNFFARHDVKAELGGRSPDMAFIDGMHHFEFALRDFAHVEAVSRPDTVVLIHDCWPLDRRTAERERCTEFWSGDIWRLGLLLRKYRPDLKVHTIATPPTGLGIVLNLDPSSRFILDNHDRLVEEYLALDYSAVEEDRRQKLGYFPNDWDAIRALLDSRRRS